MSDFQSEMNRTVQGFVAQISELARRAAIDTLESAFGSRTRGGNASTTFPAFAASLPAVSTAAAATSGRTRAARPRTGTKRTAADLEALSERVASFVKANPGLRIEQINKELGTVTKDLALPIRKLISEGVITSKGQKRSTTYYAGKKAARN
jgi:hypothetical protein